MGEDEHEVVDLISKHCGKVVASATSQTYDHMMSARAVRATKATPVS
jgi:hypothetical protein